MEKNYSTWEFQFRLYVTEKELLGHIDCTNPEPTDATKLAEWKIKDARVMSWIIGSYKSQIVLNLRPYKTAQTMWEYLKKLYNQTNSARRFHLELHQDSLADVLVVHEISKSDKFLMKLRSDFENAHSNLMNRHPSPTLDVCFGELIREGQRLLTQTTFEQEKITTTHMAFSAQGKDKGRDLNKVQCFNYKNYGHIAANFNQNAILTPEMVQQMIVSALSALGSQGNGNSLSKSWLVDSATSNHMIGSANLLQNVHPYQGSEHIQVANGNNLSITTVGDVTPIFNNAYFHCIVFP
ncbi:hypothetical protein GH714_025551 [Hevea brasiliensis]|uniref:Retrovirus-related Pol polyprotein from transposon TNT 1-94-like beta-barrel domain-containing protein n=1 Tax=Hevea brasiliensis TaxID=3981 RepID=A0A6A6M4D4_HEVBR|nr:hypothetical protein GH714_025551 [Hevea brasiliensis]